MFAYIFLVVWLFGDFQAVQVCRSKKEFKIMYDKEYFECVLKIRALETLSVPQELVSELESIAVKGHAMALIRLGLMMCKSNNLSLIRRNIFYVNHKIKVNLTTEQCFERSKNFIKKQEGLFARPSREVNYLLGCYWDSINTTSQNSIKKSKAYTYLKKATEKNHPEASFIFSKIEAEDDPRFSLVGQRITFLIKNPTWVYLCRAAGANLQIAINKKKQLETDAERAEEAAARRKKLGRSRL